MDQEKFLQAITAFSERPTLIVEEAIVNEGNQLLPHGSINFLVTGSVNIIMVGVLVVDGDERPLVIAGSTKTESSIGKKESGMFLL